MTSIGFNQPLYILPFDHPASSYERMFGWQGALTPRHAAMITATKWMIYDAFRSAVTLGVPVDKAAILVDAQFGAPILQDASARGISTCYPLGKAGQEGFDFEFGEDFRNHIATIRPTFCKVSVRYNPEDDRAANAWQAARLRRLADYLHQSSRSMFMFELLIPPLKEQLDRLHGDVRAYDWRLGRCSWFRRSKNCNVRVLSPISGKSRGSTAGRTVKTSSGLCAAAAGRESAASSIAAARTTRRRAVVCERLPLCQVLLGLSRAERASGAPSWLGGTRI